MKYLNIRTKTIFAGALGLLLFTASCEKDLEIEPITEVTSASVYKDFANYPKALGKVYAGVAIGGQSGGSLYGEKLFYILIDKFGHIVTTNSFNLSITLSMYICK